MSKVALSELMHTCDVSKRASPLLPPCVASVAACCHALTAAAAGALCAMPRRCGPLLRLYTFLLERRALAPRGAYVVAAADGSAALHAVARLVNCCLRCETCFDRTVRIAGAYRAVASRALSARQLGAVKLARCAAPPRLTCTDRRRPWVRCRGLGAHPGASARCRNAPQCEPRC